MKRFFSQSLALALVIFIFLAYSGISLAQNQTQNKATATKININTATAAELQSLPRIGPKVAQRIIDYRTQNGPFKKTEDLMKVRGIGEKIFNQIKDLITVGESK
ncbi:MAG: helix-hairpin-helix domain-containing protein [Candidatus Aminicenantes bacterium]|jgi:competence protein ComEA helix-hairpin-helix repeat region|nr:helix-hairpin-helix domain-containing protein [Candidatus Aminicenantes bacterium]